MRNHPLTFKNITAFNLYNKDKYGSKALQLNDSIVISKDTSDYEIVIYQLGPSKKWFNDSNDYLYSDYSKLNISTKGLDTLIIIGPANIKNSNNLRGFNADMSINPDGSNRIFWSITLDSNSKKLKSEDYEDIELVFILLKSDKVPNYMSKIYELVDVYRK